ncbi:hypothetical protein PpBr36_07477 [Pyricularia pennisetigena]|uniref:hypothetical protein n=1 Tax=Pyricularia pennisetigena TaxID=1578925 RepID=UPI00114E2914
MANHITDWSLALGPPTRLGLVRRSLTGSDGQIPGGKAGPATRGSDTQEEQNLQNRLARNWDQVLLQKRAGGILRQNVVVAMHRLF